MLKRLLIAIFKLYKKRISPLLPRACIFTPTCSEYGIEAIEKYGACKGFSIRRRKKQEAALQCSSSNASRYGHICPNNPDQMNFVLGQIDEILDAFEVDAMFFDMPFWPDTCHCEHCEREYQRIYGRAVPRFGVEKPVYHLLSEEKKEEYRQLIRFKSEA